MLSWIRKLFSGKPNSSRVPGPVQHVLPADTDRRQSGQHAFDYPPRQQQVPGLGEPLSSQASQSSRTSIASSPGSSEQDGPRNGWVDGIQAKEPSAAGESQLGPARAGFDVSRVDSPSTAARLPSRIAENTPSAGGAVMDVTTVATAVAQPSRRRSFGTPTRRMQTKTPGKLTFFSPMTAGRLTDSLVDYEEECPMCLDDCDDAVLTRCGHFFCRACLLSYLDTDKSSLVMPCPTCRREVSRFELSSVDNLREREMETIMQQKEQQRLAQQKPASMVAWGSTVKAPNPVSAALVGVYSHDGDAGPSGRGGSEWATPQRRPLGEITSSVLNSRPRQGSAIRKMTPLAGLEDDDAVGNISNIENGGTVRPVLGLAEMKPSVHGTQTEAEEDDDVVCDRCGLGSWVEGNLIVICDDDCGRAFHQACHRPAVRSIPEEEWRCRSCKPGPSTRSAQVSLASRTSSRPTSRPTSRPSSRQKRGSEASRPTSRQTQGSRSSSRQTTEKNSITSVIRRITTRSSARLG